MDFKEKKPIDRALELLKKAVARREEIAAEGFVRLGPDELRKVLEIEHNEDFGLLFDYLVLNKGVVKHCVRRYMDFFFDVVAEHGPMALRHIFKIESAKYDKVFEEIFDLVAVSKGALYKYVENNRYEFAMVVRSGDGDSLRSELGLAGRKYMPLWMEILNLLVQSVCDSVYDEVEVERGVQAFSMIMNGLREHRSLRSNSKMWAYETK
ncbi:hypothetical protein KJ951_00485 [Patescibacteria group bacterium]|nr:hypothetical protein [Patescibacteria group bacterium]MBU1702860.1 hypothetical protein [Patescibacteria group bacterium]MBU1953897.1 hypothetical protein [Patescibacteria group bacterium]